jgi:hypothetical protein
MPASWVSNEEALASLRAAAQREESGREDPVTGPPREMLGDMLPEWKRPTDALAHYRTVRKDYPNRAIGIPSSPRKRRHRNRMCVRGKNHTNPESRFTRFARRVSLFSRNRQSVSARRQGHRYPTPPNVLSR